MANLKLLLDTRRAKCDGTFNVIFRITHLRKVYTINSGVSIHELYWDSSFRRINKAHPNSKLLNIKLSKDYYKIEQAILMLDDEFTIEKLRTQLNNTTDGNSAITFKAFSEQLINQMMEVKRTGNAVVYQTAVNRLIAFSGEDITFEKMDYKLLEDFRHQLQVQGLKTNSISNYFRSIRAIYNQAIKQKILERRFYPFHEITIKYERTTKRAITKEQIHQLNQVSLEEDSTAKRSLDYFLLSFYLRGISFTDLAYLKPSNIIDGRLHYRRRKTHKNYSVKLFKPALEIIEKQIQDDSVFLLQILPYNITEDSIQAKKIIHQWIKTTNKYLKRLSKIIDCPIPITTYTSRHAFATIGKRLGYSNELIAEALGHEYGNKVTNIYLDSFDKDVVDAMHYRVIS